MKNTNPFIDPDDKENTTMAIRNGLGLIRHMVFLEACNNHSTPNYDDHQCGQIRLLEGLDQAVQFLEHMPEGRASKPLREAS